MLWNWQPNIWVALCQRYCFFLQFWNETVVDCIQEWIFGMNEPFPVLHVTGRPPVFDFTVSDDQTGDIHSMVCSILASFKVKSTSLMVNYWKKQLATYWSVPEHNKIDSWLSCLNYMIICVYIYICVYIHIYHSHDPYVCIYVYKWYGQFRSFFLPLCSFWVSQQHESQMLLSGVLSGWWIWMATSPLDRRTSKHPQCQSHTLAKTHKTRENKLTQCLH